MRLPTQNTVKEFTGYAYFKYRSVHRTGSTLGGCLHKQRWS